MELLEKELTGAIKGCFFEVQNQVGLGLPKEAYHQGLKESLAIRGIAAASKPEVWLSYADEGIVKFLPDFVVDNRVVLQLKAVRDDFAREHYIQLFSYLKATGIRLGLLVNFGRERVNDQRIVFDEKPFTVLEDWSAIKGEIGGDDRIAMSAVRDRLLDIGRAFGLGYGEETYTKLMIAALRRSGLPVTDLPTVEPLFNQQPVGIFPIDCLLVASRVVCVVTALRKGCDVYDLARARSYISNLHLRYGVVANFGKEQLELRGIIVS